MPFSPGRQFQTLAKLLCQLIDEVYSEGWGSHHVALPEHFAVLLVENPVDGRNFVFTQVQNNEM